MLKARPQLPVPGRSAAPPAPFRYTPPPANPVVQRMGIPAAFPQKAARITPQSTRTVFPRPIVPYHPGSQEETRLPLTAFPAHNAIQRARMKGSLTNQDIDALVTTHGLYDTDLSAQDQQKLNRLKYANEQLLRQSGRSSRQKRKYRQALEKRLDYTNTYLGSLKTGLDSRRSELVASLTQHFYNVYGANLKCAFSQGLYVPVTEGVCREMCFHWIARQRQPQPKRTFAHSKQGLLPPDQGLNSQRMRKKFRKYRELRKQANDTDYDSELVHYNLQTNPVPKTILGDNSSGMIKQVTVNEFMGAFPEMANPGFYVIALKGKEHSHVVAVSIETDGTASFMDPNLGEFTFTVPEESTFARFLGDWWNKCMTNVIGNNFVYSGVLMPFDRG
jgi:hypothetical protein